MLSISYYYIKNFIVNSFTYLIVKYFIIFLINYVDNLLTFFFWAISLSYFTINKGPLILYIFTLWNISYRKYTITTTNIMNKLLGGSSFVSKFKFIYFYFVYFICLYDFCCFFSASLINMQYFVVFHFNSFLFDDSVDF